MHQYAFPSSMSDHKESGPLARSSGCYESWEERKKAPGAGRGLQQPPASCEEQLPSGRRWAESMSNTSAPDAMTEAPHTPGVSEPSCGEHGENSMETLAGPASSPRPLAWEARPLSPGGFSHRRALSGCGAQAHVQPPGFLGTWCTRKVTIRGNSGPRLDHQGQELLLVLLPTTAG